MGDVGGRIRLALISAYGSSEGTEAAADAFAYAWEHWEKVSGLKNPAGYLYRVGQSSARLNRRRPPPVVDIPHEDDPWVEPDLEPAMAQLSPRQRAAVVLVRGFGYTLNEVADLMGVSDSTVQRHVDRGMQKLREALEVQLAT